MATTHRLSQSSTFSPTLFTLLILTTLLLPTPTAAAEFPLSLLPIYTQATAYVGECAATASGDFITSYGCDSFTNPGPCLCTDALSSSRIASRISSCAYYRDLAYSDIDSATQLWRDYCLTNGGVSVIHDETLLQDIPLMTQITEYVSSCFTAQTANFRATFGCSEYTVADCLCGDPASSEKVWATVSQCASSVIFGAESASQMASGSKLWQSYCDLNRETLASRTVGEPIRVSVTPTPTTTDPYAIPSATPATPAYTANYGIPTGTSNHNTTTSSVNVNWEAIGAIIGVCAILVALGVAWWTNRRNQWVVHAIARLGMNNVGHHLHHHHNHGGDNGRHDQQNQNQNQYTVQPTQVLTQHFNFGTKSVEDGVGTGRGW